MTSRSREGRRRGARAPGVWRGPLAATVERPAVQHGVRERGLPGARIVSGLIIVSLSALLFLFFSADAFYVHAIGVSGLHYLTREEAFALADIADMHIFWVDPAAVRQSMLRSPTVADADVQVGWPPVMVTIRIQERQPALVWEQAGVVTWIDVQGRVMQQREDRPDLLLIRADEAVDGPLSQNMQLEVDIVTGALQLRTLYPDLTALRYHPDRGLGYTDRRGWEVWFGTGTNMPEKMIVYDAIVANLAARGIVPREVTVADPHAPFYAVN